MKSAAMSMPSRACMRSRVRDHDHPSGRAGAGSHTGVAFGEDHPCRGDTAVGQAPGDPRPLIKVRRATDHGCRAVAERRAGLAVAAGRTRPANERLRSPARLSQGRDQLTGCYLSGGKAGEGADQRTFGPGEQAAVRFMAPDPLAGSPARRYAGCDARYAANTSAGCRRSRSGGAGWPEPPRRSPRPGAAVRKTVSSRPTIRARRLGSGDSQYQSAWTISPGWPASAARTTECGKPAPMPASQTTPRRPASARALADSRSKADIRPRPSP